jgi:uncharacterized membrane protein YhhN
VTVGATVFLVLAAGFAVGDWVAVARRPGSHDPGWQRALEYVCKPATLLALIGVALTLDAPHADVRAWFVVALVLSLAGDVFLMLPRDAFLPGLASFLLAHVAYTVGFVLHSDDRWWWAAPVALVAAALGARLVRGIASSGSSGVAGPVIAYVVVISTMVTGALASGNAVAAAGALLFMGSDALIGETRFVRPHPWAPVAVMVTYHLGQALLVLSLLH